MVRSIPIHVTEQLSYLPLAIGLFISVSALVALCAKHAKQVAKNNVVVETRDMKIAPRSPLRTPKNVMTTIGSKAIPIKYCKKNDGEFEAETRDKCEGKSEEGGLWQKGILMGEKCQPPDFSGVIYYDCYGNRISEMPPRSPRASPLPSFHNLTVVTDANK